MKITFVIASFYLLLCQVSAQRTDIILNVTNITPIGSPTRSFTFAADVRATLGKDVALGEKEIPAPPPTGLYLWTFVETPEEILLAPIDIRKLRSEVYLEEYHLRTQWDAGTLRFALQAGIPAFVDSIYLVDDYSDWPNNFVKFKLESGKQYDVTNPSLYNYVLRVYYNGTTLSVADDVASTVTLTIAPNPAATNTIDVHNVGVDATTLDIHDVRGVVCASFNVVGGYAKGLSVGHLPRGAYVVVERRSNGSMRRSMFIRQ